LGALDHRKPNNDRSQLRILGLRERCGRDARATAGLETGATVQVWDALISPRPRDCWPGHDIQNSEFSIHPVIQLEMFGYSILSRIFCGNAGDGEL
jgi:hypothetical protein